MIIYVISLFFDAFLTFKLVEYAFKGIQICVVYLIFSAGLKMLKGMKKTAFNMVIVATVIAAMLLSSLFAVSFSTIYYILICGAVGVFVYLHGLLRHRKEESK